MKIIREFVQLRKIKDLLGGFVRLTVVTWHTTCAFACDCCSFVVFQFIPTNCYKHLPVTYDDLPLTPMSKRMLQSAERKILVLDLDETLVHSTCMEKFHGHEYDPVKRGTPADLELDVWLDNKKMHVKVHKRPHVDKFISLVALWYDVVVYTASRDSYADDVLDYLDAGRCILRRRFYRQHCRYINRVYSKDLTCISSNMANILIIDNSMTAVRYCYNNLIHIKSYCGEKEDKELLKLLPFLDSMRFVKDVRSMLMRFQHPVLGDTTLEK